MAYKSRSPHGERGLKSSEEKEAIVQRLSLPSRGAWIEMPCSSTVFCGIRSLPSRGAWIEITKTECIRQVLLVAPLTGSVD